MSFFSKKSRSSGKGHYCDQNHGSNYYKRPKGSQHGILGMIMDSILGSKQHSKSYSDNHGHRGHKSRHKSWS